MPSRIVTLVTGCDGLEMGCRANYPFARHRAAPRDTWGFLATLASDWRGLSTFAPVRFFLLWLRHCLSRMGCGQPSKVSKTLNSLIGTRSYQQMRRILSKAAQELTVLDTLPD